MIKDLELKYNVKIEQYNNYVNIHYLDLNCSKNFCIDFWTEIGTGYDFQIIYSDYSFDDSYNKRSCSESDKEFLTFVIEYLVIFHKLTIPMEHNLNCKYNSIFSLDYLMDFDNFMKVKKDKRDYNPILMLNYKGVRIESKSFIVHQIIYRKNELIIDLRYDNIRKDLTVNDDIMKFCNSNHQLFLEYIIDACLLEINPASVILKNINN